MCNPALREQDSNPAYSGTSLCSACRLGPNPTRSTKKSKWALLLEIERHLLFFSGTPGRIRTCGLRIRRARILKFKNAVITSSWFYSNFLRYFWLRLEMFGNIWSWRAQFGHNSIEYYPLPYSSLQQNLIISFWWIIWTMRTMFTDKF
jgi:hypothetical protein